MVSSLLPLSLLASIALAAPASDLIPRDGQVQFAGVNIAGFDFGCNTDGTCTPSSAQPPLSSVNNGPDGIGQMKHFAANDGINLFRLPVGWQYLTNGNSDPTAIDQQKLATYDELVQGCLSSGSGVRCIVDIHNYARYNGAIVGQGGPSNEQFASLWSQLAGKYGNSSNVVFGIMNEPHDLDVATWGKTVQAAVTAIRSAAGHDNNIILLPGTAYTSAGGFIGDGSFDALVGVQNADGSTKNLVFDIHQYLDSDGSGTNAACTKTGVDGLTGLQSKLAETGRQALLSETGGGSSDGSCLSDVCAETAYLNQNNGQFLGYAGWAAGSFATSYVLSLTPTNNGGDSWTDQPLMKCFARQ